MEHVRGAMESKTRRLNGIEALGVRRKNAFARLRWALGRVRTWVTQVANTRYSLANTRGSPGRGRQCPNLPSDDARRHVATIRDVTGIGCVRRFTIGIFLELLVGSCDDLDTCQAVDSCPTSTLTGVRWCTQ